MVDKVAALPRTKLQDRIGQVEPAKIGEAEAALMSFLGMAK